MSSILADIEFTYPGSPVQSLDAYIRLYHAAFAQAPEQFVFSGKNCDPAALARARIEVADYGYLQQLRVVPENRAANENAWKVVDHELTKLFKHHVSCLGAVDISMAFAKLTLATWACLGSHQPLSYFLKEVWDAKCHKHHNFAHVMYGRSKVALCMQDQVFLDLCTIKTCCGEGIGITKGELNVLKEAWKLRTFYPAGSLRNVMITDDDDMARQMMIDMKATLASSKSLIGEVSNKFSSKMKRTWDNLCISSLCLAIMDEALHFQLPRPCCVNTDSGGHTDGEEEEEEDNSGVDDDGRPAALAKRRRVEVVNAPPTGAYATAAASAAAAAAAAAVQVNVTLKEAVVLEGILDPPVDDDNFDDLNAPFDDWLEELHRSDWLAELDQDSNHGNNNDATHGAGVNDDAMMVLSRDEEERLLSNLCHYDHHHVEIIAETRSDDIPHVNSLDEVQFDLTDSTCTYLDCSI